MTSFLCHCSRVDLAPLLTVPRKQLLKNKLPSQGGHIAGVLHYQALLYHIFGQNRSLTAFRRVAMRTEPGKTGNEGVELVAGARIRREMLLEFPGRALGILASAVAPSWHDVRPLFSEFRVHAQPLLQLRLGMRLDRVNRAFRLANAAIDALVGMDRPACSRPRRSSPRGTLRRSPCICI